MGVNERIKGLVKTLSWIVEGKHASTVGVFAIGMAGAWYLGDAEVTGMPPQWMMFVIAGGFTSIVYGLNHVTEEIREEF